MDGWIRTYKKVMEHWIWQDPVLFQRWMYILLLANYQNKKSLLNGVLVEYRRGELATSLMKLSADWGCDRKTVKKFLNLLKKDEMIELKTSRTGTIIKVLNYNEYQAFSGGNVPNQLPNELPNGMDNGVDTTNKEKKEKKKDILSVSKECKEIIDYLNAMCGTSYKSTTKKTYSLINTRFKEGFTVEDFKKVIATKYQEWHGNEKMEQYLRPETLFGTKFEGYLNQASKNSKGMADDNEKEPDPF